MKPLVAIIGRPNVGKSKLFNYIIGKRLSIVEDTPGVTRDRIVAETTWSGRVFDLIDTAGIEEIKNDPMKEQMMIQTDTAIEIADVVLFLTDVKTGVMAEDYEIFRKLRKNNKKVVIGVNKCDSMADLPANFYDFYTFGNPIAISAANATNLGDLLDEIVANLPEKNENEKEDDSVAVAIIGKPNVGKSSLINTITNSNRNIVSDIAGTTRDAVDIPIQNEHGKYILIDTAGIRKKSKVDERIEKFSVVRSELAVERADVCILVIDAVEGPTEQDTKILGLAHNLGKAIIILVNKWDLIQKDNHTHQEYFKIVRNKFAYATYAPILFVSALTGQRLPNMFELINKVYKNSKRELKTSDVNRIIEESVAMTQPPSDKGKKLKIYYGTQTGIQAPTFTLFVNNEDLFHYSYQRYILNNLRKAADFEGVRLKLNIKERKDKDQ